MKFQIFLVFTGFVLFSFTSYGSELEKSVMNDECTIQNGKFDTEVFYGEQLTYTTLQFNCTGEKTIQTITCPGKHVSDLKYCWKSRKSRTELISEIEKRSLEFSKYKKRDIYKVNGGATQ
jgi:hypothetical protein